MTDEIYAGDTADKTSSTVAWNIALRTAIAGAEQLTADPRDRYTDTSYHSTQHSFNSDIRDALDVLDASIPTNTARRQTTVRSKTYRIINSAIITRSMDKTYKDLSW